MDIKTKTKTVQYCEQRATTTTMRINECNHKEHCSCQQNYSSNSVGIHHQICPRKSLRRHIMRRIRESGIPKKCPLNAKPSPFDCSSSSGLLQRRAVLCGVTYSKGKFRLKGTVNDVRNMRDLLINWFGFKAEGVLVLTEEEEDERHIPTRKNIKNALEWLVNDSKNGDSLVFYFSGHGLRSPDFDDDETDGFDETICPVDFQKEGMILDNDINSLIVKPLQKGVTLHALVDACHSGTILDLEYVYKRDTKRWKDNRPPSRVSKATSGGLAICLSACEDNQLASDTSAFTGKTMNGVLTYILTEIMKQQDPRKPLTYGELLDKIYERIDQVKKKDWLMSTSFLKRFFRDRLSQKPLLSSSEKFNVYERRFII